jgi:hypothetical protein
MTDNQERDQEEEETVATKRIKETRKKRRIKGLDMISTIQV